MNRELYVDSTYTFLAFSLCGEKISPFLTILSLCEKIFLSFSLCEKILLAFSPMRKKISRLLTR